MSEKSSKWPNLSTDENRTLHDSEVVNARPVGNGLLAVTVRCCGDPSTDSVLTLHELQRDNTEIDKDIVAHQARVEKLHGDSQRAFDHVARLIKK